MRGAWWLPILMLASCSAAARRSPGPTTDFFPLAPRSEWEYTVARRGGTERVALVATVNPEKFVAGDGRTCAVVDERYADGDGLPLPIVYCVEGGYLHRVMSLEYRGATLTDNGLRSGEVKFLPIDLAHASTWEGRTSAYRLPDGSGFEVWQAHRSRPEPQEVVVSAGHFAGCIRVDTTATHSATEADGTPVGPQVVFYYSDWYAPGVGLVRTEQRDATAEILATIELVHYQIPGGASPAP